VAPQVEITVSGDLPEVGQRLVAADAALEVLSLEGLRNLAPALQASAITYIRDATPIGVTDPHLYESTGPGDITDLGDAISIDIRQTKTVGSGWILAQLLIKGHRIVTRGGVDTGRVTAPKDYVTPALDALTGELDGMLIAEGDRVLGSVVAVMK